MGEKCVISGDGVAVAVGEPVGVGVGVGELVAVAMGVGAGVGGVVFGGPVPASPGPVADVVAGGEGLGWGCTLSSSTPPVAVCVGGVAVGTDHAGSDEAADPEPGS